MMSILCRSSFNGLFNWGGGSSRISRLLSKNIQTKSKNKVTSYALNKYVSFVKSYEFTLRKKFPAAVKIYQVFSVGLKEFKEDVLILFNAFKKITTNGMNSLSRKELQVFYEMPKDIWRTSPVLFISLCPGGGIIFIVAYYFPKHLLTHHFWSLQQRSEFSLISHKRKLQCYKPVFRSVQSCLLSLKDDPLFRPMQQILDKLGSGMHPSVDLILSCKPLFEKEPYGLAHLHRSHIVGLLNMHGMHKGWNRRKRLYYRAYIIQLMDSAIIREGGVEILSQNELKWNCFFRGLNPVNMSTEDVLVWLRAWLTISQQIDENSYSLLLHCPILLGYNQPSNWSLLHDRR